MKITDLVPWRGSRRDVPARTRNIDPVGALQLDVERAFDNFWRMFSIPLSDFGQQNQTDAVRIDVSDDGKVVTVAAELPGMTESDVDVTVDDGHLRIRGEKKSDRKTEEDGVSVRERIYGLVERVVPLPEGIEPDAAKATFKNGVLTVAIPKSAETQSDMKRIPVQAG
ncbi:Hsp20/alpha crystallin family protein [Mesorhizobium sp. AR10]|uniref:Hsp20/alpha crystallin family protein n=1 Tax=Mesorhizobium sp. AR10 TaxID=2865839 RepID=UPI00216034AA|nr:Hsp20/alpha crystallin family protein [Mesorhizobium sp. AR10]UVK41010.1 Hsp20/alpha crystallin family protein [Mesorhizobium sp. AR10]